VKTRDQKRLEKRARNAKQRLKPERQAYMKAYLAEYAQTPEGKMAGKASDAKYRKSSKAKASMAKHLKTPKGMATRRRYHTSPKGRVSDAKYRKNNLGKINANTWKRRAAKLKRTPKWANLEIIKQFYVACPKGMTVDHVIPLQGKFVSGLHVENNLQYLTPEENARKNNRFVGGALTWQS
jgi:5-methylcytosine-specific restriction endonuclease McrA